jgi:hypothetical protein
VSPLAVIAKNFHLQKKLNFEGFSCSHGLLR